MTVQLQVRSGPYAERAFTLFEIAISLAILTFGVVSVMMILPSGLKAQTMTRYQMLAAVKAMEMVEANAAYFHASTGGEASQPWDTTNGRKNLQPDLEGKISGTKFGMFPLPLEIASRLTSDGDEIQQILADGGYIYYAQPLATEGMNEATMSFESGANETQRLIMAVVGYAQNNALGALPQKAWPYYATYPSPPVHVQSSGGLSNQGALRFDWEGSMPKLWEDLNLGGRAGAGLRDVFNAYKDLLLKKTGLVKTDPVVKEMAKTYADVAIRWCEKYVPPGAEETWNGSIEIPMTDGRFNFPVDKDKHIQVIASRIMGHVGLTIRACMASTMTMVNGNEQWSDDGNENPQVGPIIFSRQTVANMHANCLALGAAFAAAYPYDWGVPRPMHRSIMMDAPLIEYDLMVDYKNPKPILSDPSVPVSADLYKGPIFGDGTVAYTWRPTTPHPVVNGGVSFSNAGLPSDAATADDTYWRQVWSSTHNSTLTARFKAAERCRQIVFWAVDWQSYEDFETAPSAPPDAGRFERETPRKWFNGKDATLEQLCSKTMITWKNWRQLAYRNPELVLLYNYNMSDVPTGTRIPLAADRDGWIRENGKVINPSIHGPDPKRSNDSIDQDITDPEQMDRFNGRFGADRNANRKLDRGPVPKSVRLHATTVARFNYYDMRVPAQIR